MTEQSSCFMPGRADQKRRQRLVVLWPALLAVTISFCSGHEVVDVGLRWMSIDKVAHFFVYGLLATAVAQIPALGRWPFLNVRWAIFIASAYGMSDEIRQSFAQVRVFEIADWLADTAGALVAVPLYAGWAWYRRLLETPLRGKRSSSDVSHSLSNRHAACTISEEHSF